MTVGRIGCKYLFWTVLKGLPQTRKLSFLDLDINMLTVFIYFQKCM